MVQHRQGLMPNSEVAGITPAPGVAGRALASRIRRAFALQGIGKFRAPGVFREGAENSARGGRAPFPTSKFELMSSRRARLL